MSVFLQPFSSTAPFTLGDGGPAYLNLKERLGNMIPDVRMFRLAGQGDSAMVADAIEYLEGLDTRGGQLDMGLGRLELTERILVSQEGISLIGRGLADAWLPNSWGDAPTELVFDHTDGEAIRFLVSSPTVKHMRIDAGPARQAAAAGSNYGIRVEAPDTGSGADRVHLPHLEYVHVINQPNDGVVLSGNITNAFLLGVFSVGNGGHGVVVDRGDHTGRTNKVRPGIIHMLNCRSHDNAGHSLMVGHPDNGFNVPYRVLVDNIETYRCALASGVRKNAHGIFFAAENSRLSYAAVGGADDSGTPHVTGGIWIAGYNNKVESPRLIEPDVPITVGELSGGGTDGLIIEQPYVFATSTRSDLIVFEANVDNVRVFCPRVSGFTNVTSTSANVSGLWIQADNVISHDGTFSKLAVNGEFNVTLTGGDTDIDIAANDTNTNGQIVITQSGAGDAGLRLVAGGTTWAAGVDNSITDGFGISPAAALSSAAPFWITTGGNVGIGETAPDYKLDVNGALGFTPGSSVTPVDNGDVVFELTNNTTFTVRAKGSDGVVRSGTVTLA